MNAMIFAAGFGTRLKPLTDSLPKALIEIGNKPILQHILEKMKLAGINKVVINTHYLADMIADYIDSGPITGMEIITVKEEELLETGGGVVNCIEQLKGDSPILLYNADILTDMNLRDMISHHAERENQVTLLVDKRQTNRKLLFDDTVRMMGWMKGAGEEIRPYGIEFEKFDAKAFGGIHILNPEVLYEIKEYSKRRGRVFSITDFYVDICRKLSIGGYTPHDAYRWYDIGKPETLKAARMAFENDPFI